MRNVILITMCLVSSVAWGRDGVKVSAEPRTGFREFAGTRDEGPVFGSLGLIRNDRSTYGLRLAIGPMYEGSTGTIAALYAFDGVVRQTGNGTAGFAAAHEALVALRGGLFGLDVGTAWEHKRAVNAPEGSGLGNRSFARVSLTWIRP